jgi:hypothetical protein
VPADDLLVVMPLERSPFRDRNMVMDDGAEAGFRALFESAYPALHRYASRREGAGDINLILY